MNWIGWTWRELRRRPVRTLLTLFGVVVGVAAFVATWVTAATAKEAASSMFAALGGRAELEVRAVGQAGVDPDLIDSIRQTAGVLEAIPTVRGS